MSGDKGGGIQRSERKMECEKERWREKVSEPYRATFFFSFCFSSASAYVLVCTLEMCKMHNARKRVQNQA